MEREEARTCTRFKVVVAVASTLPRQARQQLRPLEGFTQREAELAVSLVLRSMGPNQPRVQGASFDALYSRAQVLTYSYQRSSNSGSGSSSNIGAIVGGAIGGVAGLIALLLVGLFFWRRHRLHQQRAGTQGRKSVDLLHEDSEFGAGGAAGLAGAGAGVAGASAAGDHISDGRPMSQTDTAGRLSFSSHAPTDATGTPIFTQFSRRGSAPSLPPLAFGGAGTISDTGHGDVKSSAQGPAHMRNSSGPFPPSSFNPPAAARPETPTTTDGTSLRTPMTAAQRASEKMGLPPPGTLRPVNIVQHEDAGVLASGGPSTTQNDEILELPPSYQDVRRNSGTQEGL